MFGAKVEELWCRVESDLFTKSWTSLQSGI